MAMATYNSFGYQLVESIDIPDHLLNQLFGALLLTALGVFVGGNLLLLDLITLQHSARIALPCIMLILIFYMLSRLLNSVIWGLVLIYALLWLMVISHWQWLVPGTYALGTVSLLYAVRFFRLPATDARLIVWMAVIASLTILGCQRAYTSFDMLARLHAGYVHDDTLFLASISAMIKNYGVVSFGLHGLVETHYYYFVTLILDMNITRRHSVTPINIHAPLFMPDLQLRDSPFHG